MLTEQQIEQAQWFPTSTPPDYAMVFAEVKPALAGWPPYITIAVLSREKVPGGPREWVDCITQRPVEVLRYCFQHHAMDVTQIEGYVAPKADPASPNHRHDMSNRELGQMYRMLLEAYEQGLSVDFVTGRIKAKCITPQVPRPYLQRKYWTEELGYYLG